MATKAPKKPAGLSSSLKGLSINSKTAPPDSWEEDAASDTSTNSPSTPTDTQGPGPPPPTPCSPTHRHGKQTDWSLFPTSNPTSSNPPRSVPFASPPTSSSASSVNAGNLDKRPEKSSAAAGRMIAGALGVRPQTSEEGRRYERVLREKERRRLAEDREERGKREREVEEARRRVWDG